MNIFLRSLVFINSINILADYLLIPIFALFANQISGNPEFAGILFSIQFISSAFCGLIIIKTKDTVGLNNRLLEINYLMKSAAWLLLAFSQNIPTLIIAQLIIGAASAIGGAAYQSLISEHLDKGRHVSDWGILQLLQNIAVAMGSILSGFIFSQFGFTYLFVIMAGLEMTALLLYMRIAKKA